MPSWIAAALLGKFLVFTLVLARVAGLMVTAPIYGGAEVPVRVRALFAFAIAVLVTPLAAVSPAAAPGNTLVYLTLIGTETLLGLVLGLGVSLVFTGAQIAGQLVAQLSGLQLADVINPSLDNSVPIFAQLLYMLALAMFVLLGGHRMVMDALLETFRWLPAGAATVPRELTDTLVTLVTQSFVLGIRAAFPAVAALMLATLMLGIISRTLPQLNLMALGFGFNTLMTLGILAFTIGASAWLFQDYATDALAELNGLFRQPVAEGGP
jgi:flagellar biosynthetic protein FliR